MTKIDYKKEYKDLYLPKAAPALIDVPPMRFIMVDGEGGPEKDEYQQSISVLYTLSYTIKMNGKGSAGYFDYVVPPLEGLWWGEDGGFDINNRDTWRWTSMIRQPEFVTPDVFSWAMDAAKKRKPELDLSKARLEPFAEGLCVQIMHVGPYADEPITLEKVYEYIRQNQLVNRAGPERKHHEIYLSDPNKTKPENLKTVLRLPVERA
ncbi:MAG: GyrI-like domain-containing protein [Bacillota bacterium]